MSSTKQKIFGIVVLVLVILLGVGQFFSGSLSTATQNAATANQNANTNTNADTNANNTPATQVVNYIPAAPASSTPVEKGSCFANSVAAPYRTDAFRCTVGNSISDPCFEIPSANGVETNAVGSDLLCGSNPASTNVSSTFVLQLTKPLPLASKTVSGTVSGVVSGNALGTGGIGAAGAAPSDWAWLVELADGTICTPFTGTRPFTATGDVAIYSCNGSVAGESMIFGGLNDASTTWTAELGLLSTSTKVFPPVMIASTTVPVFAVWQ